MKNLMLIGTLLHLKDKCYLNENFFLGEAFFNTNKNKFNFLYYHSFYSHFRDVCDIPLFFLINEEVSNAHERDYFPILIDQLLYQGHYKPIKKHHGIEDEKRDIAHTSQELADLLINKYNQSLGSQLLDFHVSAFSAFEKWIDRLYSATCEDHKDNLILSRKEKIIKAIINYKNDPSEKTLDSSVKKISSIPGNFISFPDKLNGLYKKISINLYERDKKQDLDIISFLGKKRNTVHNGGIHHGNSTELIHNEVTHTLETGKPAYSEYWIDAINLLGELIEIYTEILKCLPSRKEYITSFIDPEQNEILIEILITVLNDHLLSTEQESNKAGVANFLMSRANLSGKQADNLLKIISKYKRIDYSGLLFVLAHDLHTKID